MDLHRQIAGVLAFGAGALVAQPVEAASSRTTADVTVGLGYSSNPLLRVNGHSSASINISALIRQIWSTERTSTSVTGRVSNIAYLSGGYGSQQVFSLDAETSHQVSSTVTAFASGSFSGDVGGQLSNGFTYLPDTGSSGPPLPPPTTDPLDYAIGSQHQYRLSGQVGANLRLSNRDSLSLAAHGQHVFYSGGFKALGYDEIGASAGYNRQLSESLTVGGSLSAEHFRYKSGERSDVWRPALTFNTSLSNSVTASGAVGLLYLRQRGIDGHHENKLAPYISGSLCRLGEKDKLCAQISHDVQPSSGAFRPDQENGASISTVGSVTYVRSLGERESVQASLIAGRYSLPGSELHGGGARTEFSVLAGYDKGIGRRLAAGFNVGARRISLPGPDPKTDITGSVYLRYRFGDVQ